MLEGIRIVEIEGLGPGPFAGMMLADLGADVVIVHRKVADTQLAKAERNLLDRGKRSLALDLKDPADLAGLKRLVASAHGLIEGFRPGVMERLGLGPAELHAVQPRLVYGRMTGWGQSGPRAQQAGHDLNYIGLSGAAWFSSPSGQPPFPPPTLVGDIGGGALYLVAGMLAGILRAQRTGKGTVVDAAIVDGSAHMMNLLMSLRDQRFPGSERGHGMLDGPFWSRCYACADGGWISVQCLEPKFYAAFLDRLGLSGDAGFAQSYDPKIWPVLAGRLSGIFASQPQAHWVELFAGTDACVAPVLSPEQAAGEPHIASRGIWVDVDGQLQASAAPRFDGALPPTPRLSPTRGEHSAEILAELAGTGG